MNITTTPYYNSMHYSKIWDEYTNDRITIPLQFRAKFGTLLMILFPLYTNYLLMIYLPCTEFITIRISRCEVRSQINY